MIYHIITMIYCIYSYCSLDPQNATDDIVFLQEADHTELNKIVAIKADIENIPCGLVLTREPYESNAIELLNESIFLTSSC